MKQEVTQVTKDQVTNKIKLNQNVSCSGAGTVNEIIGTTIDQTLEGTLTAVIASSNLSKIFQNINQKVTSRNTNISKDFPFLILIGGIILVVIVLILFSVLTRKK